MKLAIKTAGLCASGAFIITALPGFYQQVKPVSAASMMTASVEGIGLLETLGFSLLGALVAGFLGYMLGEVLAKPQRKAAKKPARTSSRQAAVKPVKPVTGEETFLSDVEEPVTNAMPIESAPLDE